MTLEQEAKQILRNALTAYRKGEITLRQYLEVIRIPVKDLLLDDPCAGQVVTAFDLEK